MSVTVLGLGPMGRSLAGALLDAGLTTTVWNRTPDRDQHLVARGALAAPSPEAAVAASPVTLVCVVNYDAADAVLHAGAVVAALKGRTVVNLSADTPTRARAAAEWASGQGIAYLDGAIMTPAATVGTPAAVFLHSGPEEVYREHRPVLDALGGTHTYLGAEIGRAAAYDIALLGTFWTAMAGYAHALAVAEAEGITARELAPFAAGIGAILPAIFEQETHSGADNPLTSAASSLAHIIETSEAHGIDASLARAAEGLARRAIGRGYGSDGFLRIAEIMR